MYVEISIGFLVLSVFIVIEYAVKKLCFLYKLSCGNKKKYENNRLKIACQETKQ
ncbi:hypothetical protein [[Clostridium] polysaccharolyticum]|uniref:Uncharacterized protein n=1 Tax=[Clostridium] polysaccharolyticum TaxID=29364 RepID=A0A1I0CIU3_9FIRM|nr:hypothetical protein [[Clostridium] polysaccharolyticum]SET19535.1 hypothetical protein SAMN04487772_11036 [[Clostridium] polysaccharolyticum]